MSKYIDADKLIAEIDRQIKETKSMKPSFDQFWAGQISAFKGVKTIITSLQQEQPEVDFAGKRLRNEIKLREERIDELVRSLKDLQEAYEQLAEEREKMLKHALKAHRINYPDGTFIYRTKSLMSDDMGARGFERGDELKFVIVKTPLAKIIEKK